MNEIINWAILFGKIWVIVQIVGYVFTAIITIITIVVIIRAFRGRY
jgi:hypothetical protein